MESILGAVIATTVGLLCGQTVYKRARSGNRSNHASLAWRGQIERRIELVEEKMPLLIGRQEVADALNKVPPIVMQAVQQESMKQVSQPSVQSLQRPAPPQLTPDQLRSLQAHEQSMKAMQDAAALLDKFENQSIDYQRPFPTGEQA